MSIIEDTRADIYVYLWQIFTAVILVVVIINHSSERNVIIADVFVSAKSTVKSYLFCTDLYSFVHVPVKKHESLTYIPAVEQKLLKTVNVKCRILL